MLYKPSKNKRSIIVDLSPLIDVVFLLLIFLMVSTRFVDDHGMELTLPGSESKREAVVQPLLVHIDKHGEVFVGKESCTLENLKDKVRTALAQHENKTVVLKVDKSVEHGKVFKVMDAARAAGAEGLAFAASSVTESKQSP